MVRPDPRHARGPRANLGVCAGSRLHAGFGGSFQNGCSSIHGVSSRQRVISMTALWAQDGVLRLVLEGFGLCRAGIVIRIFLRAASTWRPSMSARHGGIVAGPPRRRRANQPCGCRTRGCQGGRLTTDGTPTATVFDGGVLGDLGADDEKIDRRLSRRSRSGLNGPR